MIEAMTRTPALALPTKTLHPIANDEASWRAEMVSTCELGQVASTIAAIIVAHPNAASQGAGRSVYSDTTTKLCSFGTVHGWLSRSLLLDGRSRE